MHEPLLTTPFLSVGVFLAIFVSDSLLTVHGARLYRKGADQVIVMEGSYELNPRFAQDVDRFRALTPRFLLMLGLYSLLIWLLWYLFVALSWLPQAYVVFLGAILLVQGPIHIRHIRNIFVFRHAHDLDSIQGKITYSRRFSLRISSIELLAFSILYLVLALSTNSLLLLGGGLATATLALRNHRESRKTTSRSPSE